MNFLWAGIPLVGLGCDLHLFIWSVFSIIVLPAVTCYALPNLNGIVLTHILQSKEQEEMKKVTVQTVRDALISKKVESREQDNAPLSDDFPEDENEEDFDNRMRAQILKKRRELGDVCPHETSKAGSIIYSSFYKIMVVLKLENEIQSFCTHGS